MSLHPVSPPVDSATCAPDHLSNAIIDNITAVSKDYLLEAGYPVAFAASPFLPLLLLSLMKQKHTPDTKTTFKSEYDFIVVGAGSAGSVVASRLSEEGCVTVLLLEAGKKPPLLTDVPALTPAFYRSDIDWNYFTEPQVETGSGLVDRRFAWTSGKTVGGSSILNAMFDVRGNRKNFDDWAAQGAIGWSYEDVFPYFLRLENSTTEKYLRNGYHAIGGPITMEIPRYRAKVKGPLEEAVIQLGHNFVDSNAKTQTGFFDYEATMRVGQRCSAAKGYLVPADDRQNLDIVTKATVQKVLIENKRARGVQLDHNGATHRVYARREVIVSAGAIATPKLLMLSGIGPREELDKFNIPVVSDLKVGENLQDHVASPVFLALDTKKVPPDLVVLLNPLNQLEYIENRTNKFAGTFGGPLLAFLNRFSRDPETDFPDYELYFLEGPAFALIKVFNLNIEFFVKVIEPYAGKSFIICTSQLLQPKSRGTVRLRSGDPSDPPIIDPKYYSAPEDMDVVMHGMKMCRKICNTAAMKALGCEEFKTIYPGCEQFVDDEDKYLECMVRTVSFTIWHKSCTAKMGDPADSSTVVDPELRVKGVKGLRVADGCVMPLVPSANTNVPIMMIGEKASDMIKQTFSCPTRVEGQYGVRHPGSEESSNGGSS